MTKLCMYYDWSREWALPFEVGKYNSFNKSASENVGHMDLLWATIPCEKICFYSYLLITIQLQSLCNYYELSSLGFMLVVI